MRSKFLNLYLTLVLIAGGFLGGIVCYASGHPDSKAYKICTGIGLHFQKK